MAVVFQMQHHKNTTEGNYFRRNEVAVERRINQELSYQLR
jgi:hypothetical protein